jgi:hypothetical protein
MSILSPGVALQIGLGIGRLVFGALNAIEIVLAAAPSPWQR